MRSNSEQSISESGFTLLELLVAMTLAAVVITLVLDVFSTTLYSRQEVRALGEPMSTGPQILDMVEDDLQSIWTYDIKDGRVFKGVNHDIAGYDADRLHLIVGGTTVTAVRQPDDSMRYAPVAEVSYVVRANPENAELLELWRREDPLIDEEPEKGGNYQLLTNRLRGRDGFRVTYFEDIGKEAEELTEWDSKERKTLPRRVRIEFVLVRSGATHDVLGGEVDENVARVIFYKRDVVLSAKQSFALAPGSALVPVIPDGPPEPEGEQQGGGGAMARSTGGGGGDRGNPGDRGRGGDRGKAGRGGGDQRVGPGPGKGLRPPGGGNAGDAIKRLLRGVGGSGGNSSRGGGGGR